VTTNTSVGPKQNLVPSDCVSDILGLRFSCGDYEYHGRLRFPPTSVGFLFGLRLYPEDGGDVILRNMGLSQLQGSTIQKTVSLQVRVLLTTHSA
jgi:hypothetical protein